MPKGPIRRGQLLSPFGIGALVVVKDGSSLIHCGLDSWFSRQKDYGRIQLDEFMVREWRLERRLKVDHFRLPPDYRRPSRMGSGSEANIALTMPFLRFPQWHQCPWCYTLKEVPLGIQAKVYCEDCGTDKYKVARIQVPLVAMCDAGHLQDFPWREWVHRSANPSCNGKLKLRSSGGATLGDQRVECSCSASRTLESVLQASPGNAATFLSTSLDATGGLYLCRGHMPWHGEEAGRGCARPLRGSLRSASNIYFADVKSSIFIPKGDEEVPGGLENLLLEADILSTVCMLLQAKTAVEVILKVLRTNNQLVFEEYSDQQILNAISRIDSAGAATGSTARNSQADDPDEEVTFRCFEFSVMLKRKDSPDLVVSPRDLNKYDRRMTPWFDCISQIDKLRETRVYNGFSRVMPEGILDVGRRNSLLWKAGATKENWLPAYIVNGEGIFFAFSRQLISAWEGDESVNARIQILNLRYLALLRERGRTGDPLTARFVMIHTFAHILINQLTFECGYSSASLRERLYVSTNKGKEMAGVLIYTAAGDSEGTLGGLVGMGRPGRLESLILNALERAKWCSSDPVCMEIGEKVGQGPESVNMAACHSCALIPETACEHFNRHLDRALLIGTVADPKVGFFTRATK